MTQIGKILENVFAGMNMPFYIIEISSDTFLFTSISNMICCGYSEEIVKKQGFDFWKQVMRLDDFETIKEAFDVWLSYSGHNSRRNMFNYTFNFDCVFSYINRNKYKLRHTIIPILRDGDGKLKYAVGIVTLSFSNLNFNVYLCNNRNKEISVYSALEHTFISHEINELTYKERLVLQYTAQGFSNNEISTMLGVNINTVKFHKKNIVEKLQVSNTIEALIKSLNLSLLHF
jgi:DNA-binding CsgD family transcriptional regulator